MLETFWKKISESISVICVALGITWLILPPSRYPVHVPYGYTLDDLFSILEIKAILTTGQIWTLPQLAFPNGLDLRDFPLSDGVNIVIIRLLGLISTDHFFIFNLFFWLSFVLAAVSAYWAVRWWRIHPLLALSVGLLFAFQPYHLVRNTQHLLLSSLFIIPPVLAWGIKRLVHPSPTSLNDAALGLLASGSGMYYAYFSAWVAVITGFSQAIMQRSIKVTLPYCVFVICLVAGVLWQLTPNLLYWRTEGLNQIAGKRLASEAEQNGLQLLRLLVPINSYQISPLQKYWSKPENGTEKKQYLGIAALLGLSLIGLSMITLNVFPKPDRPFYKAVGIISSGLFLLGMSGGVGTIIAYALSPQIRSYARLVPFLSFLGLFALAMVFNGLLRSPTHNSRRYTLWIGWWILTGISLLDQITWYQPHQPSIRATFESDRLFFSQLEQGLPQGSAIFQLPYKPFPESPPVYQVHDYDLLKGVLHTTHLQWSYGAMKGRPSDNRLFELAESAQRLQVYSLKDAAYNGIVIDRNGYSDAAQSLEASFSAVLGPPIMVSPDRRFSFFPL